MREITPASTSNAPIKLPEGSYKWIVLLVVSLSTVVAIIDTTVLTFALPALSEALNTNISTIVWVILAYLTVSAGLLFPLGGISDAVGRGRMLIIGLTIYTILLIAQSGAQNVYQLIATRFIQAIGTSMIHATAIALVTTAFPDQERGKAIGAMGAIQSIGLIAGPIFGGVVLDTLGWRAIFYMRIPIATAVLLFAWFFLDRGIPQPERINIDWIGALLLFGGLASMLLAVNQIGVVGLTAPITIWMITSTAILLPAFVFWEMRATNPVLDVRLFKGLRFSGGVLSMTFYYQAMQAHRVVMPFLLTEGLALAPSRAGLILGANSLIRGVMSPGTGWLSDRFHSGYVASFGLVMMAIGLFWLSHVTPVTSELLLLSMLFVVTGGAAFFDPAASSRITSSIPKKQVGTASAAIAASRQIGFSTSTAIAGAILTTRTSFHRSNLPTYNTATMPQQALVMASGETFLVTSAIAIIGLVMALVSAVANQPREQDDA